MPILTPMPANPARRNEKIDMSHLTANDISNLPGAVTAKEWKDRIYINIRGNGARMAGEGNSKVWARNGVLTVEIGKGTISSEWHANLKTFRAAFDAAVAA